MLSRRFIRMFSQYKAPQKYNEFVKPIETHSQDNISLESMNRKALTFRKVAMQDYDFVTDESDFDTARFSLKEYFYTCVFYTERTLFIYAAFMLTWMIFSTTSRMLFFIIQKVTLPLSMVGYFGMTEPAFREIELERRKQRVKYSVLHSYD